MAYGVAKGMSYLSGIGFVHRVSVCTHCPHEHSKYILTTCMFIDIKFPQGGKEFFKGPGVGLIINNGPARDKMSPSLLAALSTDTYTTHAFIYMYMCSILETNKLNVKILSLFIVIQDLAARNILVANDETCKVADFGLAREMVDNEYDVQKVNTYVHEMGKILNEKREIFVEHFKNNFGA